MNQVNYQKELDKLLLQLEREGKVFGGEEKESAEAPFLFLHSCCAPCSSYVLEYLSRYFRITVFYYNPNISFPDEYMRRVEEQKRLIGELNEDGGHYPVAVVEGDYVPEDFYRAAEGLEDCPEGGERCERCFILRLKETARQAAERGADYFATTLTISPLKNAALLNELGQKLESLYGVKWLPSDFKKRNGYKRSVELSEKYGLYRQDYCGCAFSKAQRERQKAEREDAR